MQQELLFTFCLPIKVKLYLIQIWQYIGNLLQHG